MLSKRILMMGMLSTLLTSTTLFAQEEACTTCFATLNKPVVITTFKEEQKKVVDLEKSNDNKIYFFTASLKVQDNVLPVELVEQQIKEIILVEDLEEELFFENTILADSKYYCAYDKSPLFNLFSDEYECV